MKFMYVESNNKMKRNRISKKNLFLKSIFKSLIPGLALVGALTTLYRFDINLLVNELKVRNKKLWRDDHR